MMAAKDIPQGHVEIRWSYRPDDRAKQGTTEVLPKDLARMKVAEGLATYVLAAPPVEEPGGDDTPKATKKTVGPRGDSLT